MFELEGPVRNEASLPYGSALTPGSENARLLAEHDYVEEEFLVSGTVGVYGPGSQTREEHEDFYALRPLSTVREPDVPFKTRVLVVRPREASRFSGIVHAIPFHNLGAGAQAEMHLLRRGHAWVGIECCSGTRFGADEIPSGGVANLLKVDPERYGSLSMSGGRPEHWPNLAPGAVGRAFATLDFGNREGPEMEVFRQELQRSYGQGPDIYFGVVDAIRRGERSVMPGFDVRRVVTSGASGGTEILRPLLEYHHDRQVAPDGGPLVDGYLFMVASIPTHRPKNAVLVVLESEAEASGERQDLPEDTDDPRFRYYEIPGTGHQISALPAAAQNARALADVLPEGIRGLSERDVSQEYEPYDKFNTPLIWAIWENLYRWMGDGVPMPRAPRITRDPSAPDRIARDEHGNAVGGLRTPWVDVPDARYVPRISPGNPLAPGMKRFTDEQMTALYGSREEYERRVRARLDQMVEERWVLPEDVPLMQV
jgi:hypothetical protein